MQIVSDFVIWRQALVRWTEVLLEIAEGVGKYRYNRKMRHFVQYHNQERFGAVGEPTEGEPFAVMTRKRVRGLLGSCLWAFSGAGRPREYFVYAAFRVDWAIPVADPDFTYQIAGMEGVRFEPVLRVSGYPWFEQMRRRLANFSLGLTEITESYANYLVELARGESERYRQIFEGWLNR